jgi:hypothetical protein
MFYKPVQSIPISATDSLDYLFLNQIHNRLNFKWFATEKLTYSSQSYPSVRKPENAEKRLHQRCVVFAQSPNSAVILVERIASMAYGVARMR